MLPTAIGQNLPFAIIYSLINLVFFPLNWYQNKRSKGHSVKIDLDDKLPFFSFFYLPYILFLSVIILGPYIFATLLPVDTYKPVIFSLLINLLISIFIWIFFPCVVVKPKHIDNDDHSILIKSLLRYGRDYGNCNTFPSAHISLVTLDLLWLNNFFPSLFILWFSLSILNILSVILTKQHYIWDVITGLGLSVTIYFVTLLI